MAFVFSAFERPSKTTITETKATIDKNRKEEPALVYGILAGNCSIATETDCFFGDGDIFEDISDCPGIESCNAEIEQLDCDQVKVKSTVNTKSGRINWSAQAKKCLGNSSPLLAAVDNTCTRKDGRNKGISISVRDTEIKNLKIVGKSTDALMAK